MILSPLMIILIVLTLLAVVGTGIALYIANAATRRERRALSVIKGKSAHEKKERGDKDGQHRRRAEIARKLKENSAAEDGKKDRVTIADMLQMAGLGKISVAQYWIFSVVCAIACTVAAFFLKMPGSPGTLPLVTLIGLLGVPRMLLKMKIKKRQKEFLEEFADALESMVRLLKAGMPVAEAVKMAAREFEGPVGEEMSRIYDAQKIGISLPEAVQSAAKRMPITEMQMFATGVTIQQQTGSSLSEILTNLANVIRARFKLKRKIQALSAEAKASAGIIGALPFLVGGGMYFINNEYILLLFTTSSGKIMLAIGFVMMLAGVLVMKAMINFKV